MAPLTRRRSKALDKVAQEDADGSAPDSIPISEREPTTARDRRKSLDGNGDDDEAQGRADAAEQAEPEEPAAESLATPERRKLAMRAREEDGDIATGRRKVHVEMQLLGGRSKRPRSSSVADSQDDDDVEPEADAEPESEPQSASKQLQEEASQSLASQSTEPKSEPEQPGSAAPKAKTTGKHVVFGDDDDVENFVAAAAETAKDEKPSEENREEEDDDDEAPEAVSTQAAAKETLRSAQAASEATAKQAASLKRKRQERDTLFKQQAEKRKRARKAEVHQPEAELGAQGETTEDRSRGVAEVEVGKATATGRRRAEKFNLPSMLPAEFLTDSSEDEDESALKKRAAAVKEHPKKTTFEDVAQALRKDSKRPRDRVVGSTIYRVMAEQGDRKLAPKMHKNSRIVKDDLLKRRRVGVTPNKKKGFFVTK